MAGAVTKQCEDTYQSECVKISSSQSAPQVSSSQLPWPCTIEPCGVYGHREHNVPWGGLHCWIPTILPHTDISGCILLMSCERQAFAFTAHCSHSRAYQHTSERHL